MGKCRAYRLGSQPMVHVQVGLANGERFAHDLSRHRIADPGRQARDGLVNAVSNRDMISVEYHGFSGDEDEKEIEAGYRSWLGTVFG